MGKGEQDADGYCGNCGDDSFSCNGRRDRRRTPAGGSGTRLLLELPRPGVFAGKQEEHVGAGIASHSAGVWASERQNVRVALVDYLSMQSPGADAGAPLTTANNAIALAQGNVVTAFIRHKEAPK